MIHMLTAPVFRLVYFFTAEVSRAPAMMSSQSLAVNCDRGCCSSGLILTYGQRASVALNVYMV